jgi:phage/plasmid-like protein (TIGR03299 family)
MTAHVENMAYAQRSGKPWHGLGVEVNNDMTPDEILVAAGLDWTVSKRPMYFPKVTADGSTALRIVPDEFALIRDSDESVLDTVGLNFKPVQNRDVLDFFTRFVKAGDMTMETAGSLKRGKFIWALARIAESFKVGNKDEVRGYLLLSQPHQFGFSLTAATTPVCVVCWNTLNFALGSSLDGSRGRNSGSFRMPHSRAFDTEVKAAAEQALGLAAADMKAFSHTAELLAAAQASESDVIDYFHEVARVEIPDAEQEEVVGELVRANDRAVLDNVLQLTADDINSRTVKRFHEAWLTAPGQDLDCRKNTWWGAANAITYTADHVMSRDADQRMASAWYGRAAGMKRRAIELAVERVSNVTQTA